METTLMELVNDCEFANENYEKTDENLNRASFLEELGFTSLSKEIMEKIETKDKLSRVADYGDIKITDENIEKFLDKKVELYNAEHGGEETTNNSYPEIRMVDYRTYLDYALAGHTTRQYMANDGTIVISEGFGGFPSLATPIKFSKRTCDYRKPTGIGKFEWKEENLANYKSIPPQDVLEKLMEHRDRNVFDYFTIASVESIPDPLLLGRVNGSDNRYFIAQWGKDIALEDVI